MTSPAPPPNCHVHHLIVHLKRILTGSLAPPPNFFRIKNHIFTNSQVSTPILTCFLERLGQHFSQIPIILSSHDTIFTTSNISRIYQILQMFTRPRIGHQVFQALSPNFQTFCTYSQI